MPVFVAQGDTDQVIPRELLDRSWSYLLADAGSPVEAHRDPGGHGITSATLHLLASWAGAPLGYLFRHGRGAALLDTEPRWPTLLGGSCRPVGAADPTCRGQSASSS